MIELDATGRVAFRTLNEYQWQWPIFKVYLSINSSHRCQSYQFALQNVLTLLSQPNSL